MIRRPPRSTLDRSSAASDVYKRQPEAIGQAALNGSNPLAGEAIRLWLECYGAFAGDLAMHWLARGGVYLAGGIAVSYTHLRAHETVLDLVCPLLLVKKKTNKATLVSARQSASHYHTNIILS